MSRHAEKNPEIRRPEAELPLFEQGFTKFEHTHSAFLGTGESTETLDSSPQSRESANPQARILPRQSPTEQTKSCLTAPLSAHGETGAVPRRSEDSIGAVPDVARARKSDPGTSFQAAASVTNLGRVRDGILEIFREHGPQIDEDLIVIYHNREKTRGYKLATDQSIRSRRKELERDFGKLVCCGAKENKRKRMSQIWRLK